MYNDYLTIYDKEDASKIVWEGIIDLKMLALFTETACDGFWIHADQKGIDRNTWGAWFSAGNPAKLVPAGKNL